MAAPVRLPIRMTIGDIDTPIEVGTVEFPYAPGTGGFAIDYPSLASALRQAADKLDPGPTNEVYRERARLVAYLAAQHPGDAVISYSDPSTPGWPVITINTPAGQMSWHISPDDIDVFPPSILRVHPEDPRATWDGHTTAEKHERLANLTRQGR
ncbi:WDGH domain-containing protein [Thermomonospora cellulosilytica]|uniref:WDGH domain-containing protein n=1 Tax=Thermomonospora cellulosilytica TaxID=1411118 RepID=A0A7W3MXM1_9ACTN|nr:hypothetical protein [Thermomonospora cellulosilytica]MBA9003746.1 hypothetical protein [Thermomonospora cellulosilytica]